jgi:hypothetical protein
LVARRWGKELTNRYFEDLHDGAQHIAENHDFFCGIGMISPEVVRYVFILSASTTSFYEPLAERFIAIVAVIRQGRDVPAILQKWAAPIRRELVEIRGKIERGEIRGSARRSPTLRRKK